MACTNWLHSVMLQSYHIFSWFSSFVCQLLLICRVILFWMFFFLCVWAICNSFPIILDCELDLICDVVQLWVSLHMHHSKWKIQFVLCRFGCFKGFIDLFLKMCWCIGFWIFIKEFWNEMIYYCSFDVRSIHLLNLVVLVFWWLSDGVITWLWICFFCFFMVSNQLGIFIL